MRGDSPLEPRKTLKTTGKVVLVSEGTKMTFASSLRLLFVGRTFAAAPSENQITPGNRNGTTSFGSR
ncbi:hypothetical protein L596_014597 [Steinernema carpocapsae]|uniref:Uncharacterized protein n=1 Tax=Steinernema carpocapsae TaxID=34508 RepID=A0A4V6A2Z4_STECR|nr:hypothetical protein L596_014597 [Steinernema carpocapsae]